MYILIWLYSKGGELLATGQLSPSPRKYNTYSDKHTTMPVIELLCSLNRGPFLLCHKSHRCLGHWALDIGPQSSGVYS